MSSTGKIGKFCIFCTTGAIIALSLVTAGTLIWVWML